MLSLSLFIVLLMKLNYLPKCHEVTQRTEIHFNIIFLKFNLESSNPYKQEWGFSLYSFQSVFYFWKALYVSHGAFLQSDAQQKLNHDQYELQELLTETLTDITPAILHIRRVSKTQFPGTISLREPCQPQHYLEDMFCMFLKTHCQTSQEGWEFSNTSSSGAGTLDSRLSWVGKARSVFPRRHTSSLALEYSPVIHLHSWAWALAARGLYISELLFLMAEQGKKYEPNLNT